MLCYGMIWQKRIYEIVCYRIIFLCYGMKLQNYAMRFQSYTMLCYCVCCKRYAWSDWTLKLFVELDVKYCMNAYLKKIKVSRNMLVYNYPGFDTNTENFKH